MKQSKSVKKVKSTPATTRRINESHRRDAITAILAAISTLHAAGPNKWEWDEKMYPVVQRGLDLGRAIHRLR